jgi:hypothetical protein
MHETLRKRTITATKSQVNVLRSQGVRVSRDTLDDIMLDVIKREGVALAKDDEDRVFIMCPDAPLIGDQHDIEHETKNVRATVVSRYLFNDNEAVRLVVESSPVTPGADAGAEGAHGSGELIRQVFTVVGADEPEPEEGYGLKRAEEIAAMQFEQEAMAVSAVRKQHAAFNTQDMDRVMYEELTKKEYNPDATPDQVGSTDGNCEKEKNKTEERHQYIKCTTYPPCPFFHSPTEKPDAGRV